MSCVTLSENCMPSRRTTRQSRFIASSRNCHFPDHCRAVLTVLSHFWYRRVVPSSAHWWVAWVCLVDCPAGSAGLVCGEGGLLSTARGNLSLVLWYNCSCNLLRNNKTNRERCLVTEIYYFIKNTKTGPNSQVNTIRASLSLGLLHCLAIAIANYRWSRYCLP